MQQLLKTLKASAEVTRLRILAALAHSELTVTELVSILGQSQPRVSRHLKLMVDAGLLARYQEGSWVFHRLADPSPGREFANRLIELVDYTDATLKQDQARLAQIKQDNAERASSYFRTHAANWDRLRETTAAASEIEIALLKAVAGQSFSTLVDMGTGTGRLLQLFAPQIARGTGFDLSHEMLNVARANLDAPEFAHCQVRQADIRNLPLEAESADLLTIHQVLHYLDDPLAVIREASRILNSDGVLLIVDFARHELESLRSEHAHRRLGFDDSEIQQWAEASGLEILSSQAIGNARQNNNDTLKIQLWQLQKQQDST